jgi:hypothetical protein
LVAHALLTRPPLSLCLIHPKVSLTVTPLDLHVLGTPPAFILSQDQTLIKNFSSDPVSSKNWLGFVSSFLLFSFQRTLKPLFALGFLSAKRFQRPNQYTIFGIKCQPVESNLSVYFH